MGQVAGAMEALTTEVEEALHSPTRELLGELSLAILPLDVVLMCL
jgi:hypothetical protein